MGYASFIAILCFIGFAVFALHRAYHVFDDRSAQQLRDNAAVLLPENYKPAGIYLARLMQSDPALWTSDSQAYPASDWLPPELGRVHLWEFEMTSKGTSLGWGGGGDDDLGRASYAIWPDSAASNESSAAYVLTYGYSAPLDGKTPAKGGEFHFAIAKADQIDEEEFVKLGLTELARRQAAYAAGTEFNVYGDNPAAERQRLLSQHPAITSKLRQTDPGLVNGN